MKALELIPDPSFNSPKLPKRIYILGLVSDLDGSISYVAFRMGKYLFMKTPDAESAHYFRNRSEISEWIESMAKKDEGKPEPKDGKETDPYRDFRGYTLIVFRVELKIVTYSDAWRVRPEAGMSIES